ncbi:hypothetical protein [Rugamonas sp.]|uniref:hypothetical protein n=1 Tax=Rugamonas sp. TaxID=1926287 RepID=UPI0025D92DA4|nr:hypothetical protein [Rugamonas sp.]
MKTTSKLFAAVLFSLPLLASAAGTRSASFQVSFVVKDSCNVQAGATASAATTPANKAAAARPAVACQLSTPYLVTRGIDKAGANIGSSGDSNVQAIRPAAGAQDWTIYF